MSFTRLQNCILPGITMKQVLQNLSNGETTVDDVPVPSSAKNRLIVQSRNTLISAGTEKMLVEFGQAGFIGKARAQPEKVKQVLDKIRTDGLRPTLDAVFSKLGEPLPLGYCNAGVVTELGGLARGFEVGDRVVSNGPHAEFVSVPSLLCAKIPVAVSDEEACFTVLGSIALQGVRLIQPTLGETVVVYGLGLIGLVAVQLLKASGCSVIGVDISSERLALAKTFGATGINGGECDNISERVKAITAGRGADAVLITASAKTDAIVSDSARMCRKRGRVVLVGVVGLKLNRNEFYEKEISFQVSCSYGPGRYDDSYEQDAHDYPIGFVRWTEQRNFEAILQLLADKSLDFKPLISHRFPIAEAPAAYKAIQNDRASLGVVLDFEGEPNASRTVKLTETRSPTSKQTCVAAVIGAGNFTRATLMPALAKTPMHLKSLVGRSNTAAVQSTAKRFGVGLATSDIDVALGDPDVNLVLVSTNHDSHAYFARKILGSGKNAFIEKPLALNVEELASVVQAAESSQKLSLTVGFNRRFSPHMTKARELLAGRNEPLAMNIVVNAGAVPADHWVHDPRVGGGRIIGEACHFLDLGVFLTGNKIASVSAHRFGASAAVRDDKFAISVGFEDGSVLSLSYFANGAKSYPKERIEVFSDERVLAIDNFRRTTGFGFKGFKKKFVTKRQEKGHQQQFLALANAVCDGERTIPLTDLVNVTLASFAAVDSANSARTIQIDEEYASDIGRFEE